jgi:hypothetical protein
MGAYERKLHAYHLGRIAAEDYRAEFGSSPNPETIGDWDSTAWGEVSHSILPSGTSTEEYETCLEKWRAGFFGETIEV